MTGGARTTAPGRWTSRASCRALGVTRKERRMRHLCAPSICVGLVWSSCWLPRAQCAAAEPPLADAPLAPQADLCFLPVESCPSGYRVWASTEYLLWWVKGSPVPSPIVTTGPAAATGPTGGAGVLGAPGTTLLLGNQNLNFGPASGGRFTLGTWLNREGTVGLEGGYFFLSQRTSTQIVGATRHARFEGPGHSVLQPGPRRGG